MIANKVAGKLQVIEPQSQGEAGQIDIGGQIDDPVTDGKSIWVLDRSTGELIKIDPSKQSEPVRFSYDGEITSLAFGGKSLWAVQIEPSAILEVDPSSGEVLSTIALDQDTSKELFWSNDALWLVLEDNEVRSYNPGSGELLDSITLDAGFSSVLVDEGALWVSYPDDGFVKLVDLETEDILLTVPIANKPGEMVKIGDDIWVVAGLGSSIQIIDGDIVRQFVAANLSGH